MYKTPIPVFIIIAVLLAQSLHSSLANEENIGGVSAVKPENFKNVALERSGLTTPPNLDETILYSDANLTEGCVKTYSIANRDCTGNDGDAYNTIQKAASNLSPGDTLLIREGIYREQILLSSNEGTSKNKIKIKAFPHETVEINAAEVISIWQKCRSQSDCQGNPNWNNVYYAKPGFKIKQLFQHNQKLKPSRYPNEGWQYPTSIGDNPQREFSDISLDKINVYFDEAIANIKTTPYWISDMPVGQSFSDGRIILEKEIETFKGPISMDYGFYFTNIVEEINEPGEWAYDDRSGKLFLWPKDNLDNIQAGKRDHGINLRQVAYYEVSGFTVNYANSHGIWIHGSDHNLIDNVKVNYAFQFGIFIQGGFSKRGHADYNKISNSKIRYSSYRGISNDSHANYLRVTNNLVYATGAKEFGDDLYHGVGHGIFIEGEHTEVLNNVVDRTGYTGIYIGGSERSDKEIAYNAIYNTNLSLTDGGGIYAGGKSNSGKSDVIHHNILKNIYGYVGGIKTSSHCDLSLDLETCAKASSGIYIDEQGNNFLVQNNTVMNAKGAGIYFHWTKNNSITNNVLYGNGIQIWLSGKNEPKFLLEGNDLSQNIMYSTSGIQNTFFLGTNYDGFGFGKSINNYLLNPYIHQSIRSLRYMSLDEKINVVDENLSLSQWQDLSKQEVGSLDIAGIYRTEHKYNIDQNDSVVIFNATMEDKNHKLNDVYCDLKGEKISDNINLTPFSSKILLNCFCNNDQVCNNNEDSNSCPRDCAL